MLAIIDAWFARHFSHITPGTPDHAVLIAAVTDLKAAIHEPEAIHEPTPETTPNEQGE